MSGRRLDRPYVFQLVPSHRSLVDSHSAFAAWVAGTTKAQRTQRRIRLIRFMRIVETPLAGMDTVFLLSFVF